MLDVTVPLRFALERFASKVCFHDKSQPLRAKCRDHSNGVVQVLEMSRCGVVGVVLCACWRCWEAVCVAAGGNWLPIWIHDATKKYPQTHVYDLPEARIQPPG